MSELPLVVIIVPSLNEEENLRLLYERIANAVANEPIEWQLLLVDDGSTDNSAQWASEKARGDRRVRLLRLSRNFGHQVAITAGLDRADGDAVIIMDADLQDPPEVIPDLLAKWREGYDVVYAVRTRRQGETWLKKFLAAAFYKAFQRMANIKTPVNAGDFRLLDRKVVVALREVRELHRFMRGLTSWVGFRQGDVTYERAARYAGKTKYPLWKSVSLAWDALTSFSATPLRWIAGIGVGFMFLGASMALYVIAQKLLYPERLVEGWASLAAMLLVFGGVQLLSLGVVGQYVSRIFEESKKRPLYIVYEDTGVSP